jgi:predicted PurR-regulated permease PerM
MSDELPDRLGDSSGRLERRKSTNTVELSYRSTMTFIAMVLSTLAVLWIILQVRGVVTWVVVSGFFAVVLTPPVNLLHHRARIRRGFATAIVFLSALGILIGLTYSFVRPIVAQTSKFVDDLPAQVTRAQEGEGPVGKLVKRYEIEDWVAENQTKLQDSLSDLGSNALGVVQSVISSLFAVLTIAVLTVLMLMQGPSLLKAGLHLLNPEQQERMIRIGNDSARAITGYVAGNLVISMIAGVTTWIFLTIVGVPFAGVLALWVAFADLIPLVGATMGAIPTVAVAFLHSVPAGIAALIFYICYQQFENHVLQPSIMARAVSIRPLVVMVSVLAGVEIFGILGALLAIPVAGVVKVVGTEILRIRRPDLMAEVDARNAEEARQRTLKPSLLKRLLNRNATRAQNNVG